MFVSLLVFDFVVLVLRAACGCPGFCLSILHFEFCWGVCLLVIFVAGWLTDLDFTVFGRCWLFVVWLGVL